MIFQKPSLGRYKRIKETDCVASLQRISTLNMSVVQGLEIAYQLDQKYPAEFRNEFAIPTFKSLGINDSDEESLYFCGNSLGLMPLATEKAVNTELTIWKQRGVVGHFDHPAAEPWVSIDDPVSPLLAPILGAKFESEVAAMNTLTGNLHTLMATFYKPTKDRYKILYEKKAFPSDNYAFRGIAQLHGFDTEDALIALAPREHEFTLRTEDILKCIEEQGEKIAVVIFSGIQFYTGQFFHIEKITKAAKSKGSVVGWDLAHAVGNVPLKLHDWKVDFAVFCTYKYLNAGPGGIGGIFVHNDHANDQRPRMAGWWGNNSATRFQMNEDFDPIPGAKGFRMSNPSVLNTVCLTESLKVFAKAGGVQNLHTRSESLTGYLLELLTKLEFFVPLEDYRDFATGNKVKFTIITPTGENERGAQLSLLFLPHEKGVMDSVFNHLYAHGVVADERKPDVIRLAPNSLYNTHEEVFKVVQILEKALEEVKL